MIRLSILNPSIIPLIHGFIDYTEGLDLNIPNDNDIEDYDNINITF